MARHFIVLPLALLLSVSPVLPSFAAYICYCEGGPGGFHLHYQVDDHGAYPDSTKASHHSAEDGENRQGCHSERGTNQSSGISLATSVHSGGAAPNSCSCDQTDIHTLQTLAATEAGKTSRKSIKKTSSYVYLNFVLSEARLLSSLFEGLVNMDFKTILPRRAEASSF